MICKRCGAQIEDNAAECKFCGAVYEENIQPEPETEEAEIRTPEENETVSDGKDESFGTDTEEMDIEELFDENEIKRKRQQERLNAEKKSQLNEIEKRRKAKKFKQKRNKILTVVIIVAFLAAIGGGSYMIWKHKSEAPDIVIATQTPTETPTAAPQTESPEATEAATEIPSVSPTPTEAAIKPVSGGGTSASGSASSTASNKAAQQNTSSGTSTAKATVKPAPAKTPAPAKAPAKTPAPAKAPASVSGAQPSTSNVSFGGKEYNATGGYKDGKFSAALVTGVEVIGNGDKNYMAFKFNGATYYANVSAGTTTQFVSGRPMTINAYKTSETYNGSPVYEISAVTNYTGKNIFPNSGFELLTEKDLAGKSAAELRLGRNEIYARHGRAFKDNDIRKYFEGCSWYKVKSSYNYSNEASNLNSIEKANVDFILKHEK